MIKVSPRKSGLRILAAGVALLWAAHNGMAQENASPAASIPVGISSPAAEGQPVSPATDVTAATPGIASAPPVPEAIGNDNINPNDIPSVLFTFWEQTAIQDMKNARGETREVTPEELASSLNNRSIQKPKPPPEEREIRLAGIVFVNSNDWTIWLNGKRVTPRAIPREVLDLKVYKEYVEMKWFDNYTNQIFPIRLRTHQRFNIDSRIFLPG